MYQFSGKLKTIALALMVVGALGVISGFLTTPSSVAEVKEQLHNAHQAHGAHGAPAHHEEQAAGHSSEVSHETHATQEENSHHDELSEEDAHAAHVFHQLKKQTLGSILCRFVLFLLGHCRCFGLQCHSKSCAGRLVHCSF